MFASDIGTITQTVNVFLPTISALKLGVIDNFGWLLIHKITQPPLTDPVSPIHGVLT